jgi:hypothetical protein
VDNIKIDLREIGWDGMDWIDLAQDRDQFVIMNSTSRIFDLNPFLRTEIRRASAVRLCRIQGHISGTFPHHSHLLQKPSMLTVYRAPPSVLKATDAIKFLSVSVFR